MQPKWSSKFELKPGRWVFVPTPDSVAIGREIKKQIEARWRIPYFYFHLRQGGHIAAMKSHLAHSIFLHLDIQDFFGAINKTRVTRCLKRMFSYNRAREWTNASTVSHPNDKARLIIPYGFVQSQIIASVCLSDSALGRRLQRMSRAKGIAVSVYVDDIVVSCDDTDLAASLHAELQNAAVRSRFMLNPKKEHGPAAEVKAFNISLSKGSMLVEEDRLQRFVGAIANAASDAQRKAIIGYIASVNEGQASAFP